MKYPTRYFSCALCAVWTVISGAALPAANDDDFYALVEQNRELRQQVGAQQKQIDELRTRLDRLEPSDRAEPAIPAINTSGRQIRISGEAGVAVFRSRKTGSYPNPDFRVDEAKLFIEAPIWQNVYFFGGIDLATRESGEAVSLGELYLDAENIFSTGPRYTLSLRAGRFNTPFGEEYRVRNVVDNPLVTHSLADIWGLDNGIQIYGTLGRFKYNLAVQNGGAKAPGTSDLDKAVTARVSTDVSPHLHLSASAMRTGRLDAADGSHSKIWLGNTFFRALGSPGTTQTYSADLLEFDASTHWKTGYFQAMVGWISFQDDSTAANNARHLSYYSLEADQTLAGELSGVMRFSGIRAPGGYPLAGLGNTGYFFYNPYAPLTTELQRISVGLNYRFAPPLVWKIEYSRETGHLLNGLKRKNDDVFSTLLGIKF